MNKGRYTKIWATEIHSIRYMFSFISHTFQGKIIRSPSMRSHYLQFFRIQQDLVEFQYQYDLLSYLVVKVEGIGRCLRNGMAGCTTRRIGCRVRTGPSTASCAAPGPSAGCYPPKRTSPGRSKPTTRTPLFRLSSTFGMVSLLVDLVFLIKKAASRLAVSLMVSKTTTYEHLQH